MTNPSSSTNRRSNAKRILRAAMAATPAVLAALSFNQSVKATDIYWDVNSTAAGSGAAASSGTWDTATANWSTSSAGTVATQVWVNANQDQAIFSAGTTATGTSVVTVSGSVDANRLIVEDGTVTLTGGTVNLVGSAPLIGLTVNSTTSRNMTISSILAGSNGVTISGGALALGSATQGSGTLTLSGLNTYTGGTTIGQNATVTAGVINVVVNNNNAFGANGGTVSFASSTPAVQTIASRAHVVMNNGFTLTQNFSISGGGARDGYGQLTTAVNATGTVVGNILVNGAENNSGGTGSYLSLATIGAQTGGRLIINGQINNRGGDGPATAGAWFAKGGRGTVVLTQSSPGFIAGMRILDGPLEVQADGALGAAGTDGLVDGNTLMNTAAVTAAPATTPQLWFRSATSLNYAVGQTSGTGTYRVFTTAAPSGYGGFSTGLSGIIGAAGNAAIIQNKAGVNNFGGGWRISGTQPFGAGTPLLASIGIDADSLELSGVMYASALAPDARNIYKIGPGELIISGKNDGTDGSTNTTGFVQGALQGMYIIKDGTLTIRDNPALAGGGVVLGNNGLNKAMDFQVANGATFKLDNSLGVNNSRIRSNAVITMAGGDLVLNGNATASTDTGTLASVVHGYSALNVTQPVTGNSSTTTLTVGTPGSPSAITRNNRGTVLFRGVNQSSAFIKSGGTLKGLGLSGSSISILPEAVGTTAASGEATDFVTLESNNVRVLASGEYGTLTSGNAVQTNAVATANTAINSDTIVNALKITGSTVTVASGKSLSILSGGILGTGAASSITGAGSLSFESGGTLTTDENGFTSIQGAAISEGIITVPTAGMTIGTSIVGAEGITKSGPGTLTLTGTSGYGSSTSGKTTVNSGILSIASDAALGVDGAEVVLNGGTLEVTGNTTAARGVDLANPVGNVVADLGVNAISVTGANVYTLNGVVQSATTNANLVKIGTGDLVLGNTGNSYSGGTFIRAGQVSVSAPGNLGTVNGNINGAVYLNGGALHVTASNTFTNALWVNSATAGIKVDAGQTAIFSGIIQGNANLVLDGGGLFNPIGNNLYFGNNIVSNGSTLQYTVSVGQGQTLDGSTSAAYWTLNNGILSLVGAPTGSVVTAAATKGITLGAGGGTLEVLPGTFSGYFPTIAGTIAGTGTLNKTGPQGISIGTSNTYTGKTTITAGTLRITGDTGLGAVPGAVVADQLTIAGSATLTIGANISLAANRGVTLGSGTGLISVEPAIQASIAGIITGAGSLTRSGSGTLVLMKANTYSGPNTNLVGGADGTGTGPSTLKIGINNALPVGTTLNLNALSATGAAIFDMSNGAASFSQTLAALTNSTPGGVGIVRVTSTGTGNGTLTITGTSTYTGVIQGNLNLAKTTGGTFTLGAVNSYAGTTAVTAGTATNATLKNGVAGALPATTTLTLTNGATGGIAQFDVNSGAQTIAAIAGSGTVIDTGGAGSLSIATAGSITPGTAGTAGTLTVNSSAFNLGATEAFNYDLANALTVGGGVNDLLVGNPAGGGAYTLNITAPGGLTGGNYTIIDGTALSLTAGQFSIGTAPLGYTYGFSVVSNDLILTVTPPAGPNEWQKAGGLNGGSYDATAHWSQGTVPSGLDAVARFRAGVTGALIDGPATVTVDTARTVGTILIDNATNSYTIAGPQAITIDTTGAAGVVQVDNGTHTISAGLNLNKTTGFAVATGASLTASALNANGQSVNKTGAGTLTVNRVIGNTLAVSGGRMNIQPISDLFTNAGVSPHVSNVTSVTVTGGAKLNLSNSRMVTNDAQGVKTGFTYSGILGLVQTGRNGGAWNGPGIITDQADALANKTSIGVATATEAKGLTGGATTMWSGQTIDANDTLIMYTYAGDANLDGTITADDYASIDLYFLAGGQGTWYRGDFNYDGEITADDYALIDSGFLAASTPLWVKDGPRGTGSGATAGLSAVPEPASVSVLALGALSLLGRRSRREKK